MLPNGVGSPYGQVTMVFLCRHTSLSLFPTVEFLCSLDASTAATKGKECFTRPVMHWLGRKELACEARGRALWIFYRTFRKTLHSRPAQVWSHACLHKRRWTSYRKVQPCFLFFFYPVISKGLQNNACLLLFVRTALSGTKCLTGSH